MDTTQADAGPEAPDSDLAEAADFVLSVFKGCVLPEDYSPVRVTTWGQWCKANPDDYSPEQLNLIRAKLLAGKSWVCFVKRLETISAPDYYKRTEPYCNPIRPRDPLV